MNKPVAAPDSKRLSDAELAAEYWAPLHIAFPGRDFAEEDFDTAMAVVRERTATILRFALNPAYDSVPEPGKA